MVPDPWTFTLLALAAFSVWKLLGDDSILDRPRDWAVERMGDRFDDFLTCPWCAGFWICLIAYAGWVAFGAGELVLEEAWMGAATVMAMRAVVGLVASAWERIST